MQRGTESSSHVTLDDVARLAEVSLATASKALNGRPHVADRTRDQVRAAAEQLGYSPNAQARSLVAGRTGLVGLLTSDLSGRFSLPILVGAEDGFGSSSVSAMLCDARDDPIRERHHLATLLSQRVDGLIVVGARPDPRPSLGDGLPVPVVYAYAASEDEDDLSLVVDNVGGGRLAVEHLVACGRRRIAHISGEQAYGAARARAEGALAALGEHDLSVAGGDVLYGSWTEAWGRSATRLLLADVPDVDGIFAASDQIARGVLDVLKDSGRHVPTDVSVVGFDNWDIFTDSARPPMTSVDMNLQQLGRSAAVALSRAVEGVERSGVERLPCRLVPRESSVPGN